VLAQVETGVEQLRGLHFIHPVVPEPVSQSQIGGLLHQSLDQSFPPAMMDRRSRAWSTIGLIPAGTDLRAAIGAFGSSQVIGFYDTLTHQVVFSGSDSPTPYQRVTLSHELTHALDDQHFDLGRLDVLEFACQDEREAALSALAEGDAVTMSLRWAVANLSPQEQVEFQQEASAFPPPPPSVPPFLVNLLTSPYPNGEAFVQSLLAKGGIPALNHAFQDPPVDTEQILHPDRYPGDRPQNVNVPNIAEKLGGPWQPLDVYQVGELWLRLMLQLRLGGQEADAAAAGWDGGEYRAWSNGQEVAVLLQTKWDTKADAVEFAHAMRDWIGNATDRIEESGTFAQVLFGSSSPVLRDLQNAAG